MPMTSNLTRCLFFSKKNSEYQCFVLCCPETSSCASKPLLLRCKLVIPQCLCQVSLGLKEVQTGAHNFKLNKVPLFSKTTMNINVSIYAALKLSIVPAIRYYMTSNLSRCLFFALNSVNINVSRSAAPKVVIC